MCGWFNPQKRVREKGNTMPVWLRWVIATACVLYVAGLAAIVMVSRHYGAGYVWLIPPLAIVCYGTVLLFVRRSCHHNSVN